MIRTTFIRFALVPALALLAALASPPAARAWGCQGHEIVALIAEANLNPRALATANDILKNAVLDPGVNRYCKEDVDAFAQASTWADDIRQVRPQDSPWHFIDIPRGASRADMEKYCPQDTGCILSALRAQLEILKSPNADAKSRGDALKFVIHFIGDMHQPLHDVDNNDHGGNCVPVAFFGAQPQLRNPQSESYAPNLHGVWDTDILVRSMNSETVQQIAADLEKKFAQQVADLKKQPADFDAWAWQSHELAEQVVYGKLPVLDPAEQPVKINTCADDNHVAQRMLALHEDLEQPYEEVSAPVIDEQLAHAGARLAAVLNSLWPEH